jgi:hypothetical protein
MNKKPLLSFYLLILSGLAFSQQDSTRIYFQSQTNPDIRMRDELLGIQQVTLECKDTLMRGKVFFLTITEIMDGKVKSQDTVNAACSEMVVNFKVGDKTVEWHANICDKMSFGKKDSAFPLSFCGMIKDTVFKMNIKYPGYNRFVNLNGNEKYMLSSVNACSGKNYLNVPVHKKVPFMTYAPPFKSKDDQFNSYCLRGEEEVESWYETFKIKHYYIFYLGIK